MAQDLLQLEEQGWRALSLEGNAGKKFYSSLLADDAVMLFPGGMFIWGKEEILRSIGSQPWRTFQIEEAQVIPLSESSSSVAYKVTAQREGGDPYTALVSSTYSLQQGDWKLVFTNIRRYS